jgi:hypothetical protein
LWTQTARQSGFFFCESDDFDDDGAPDVIISTDDDITCLSIVTGVVIARTPLYARSLQLTSLLSVPDITGDGIRDLIFGEACSATSATGRIGLIDVVTGLVDAQVSGQREGDRIGTNMVAVEDGIVAAGGAGVVMQVCLSGSKLEVGSVLRRSPNFGAAILRLSDIDFDGHADIAVLEPPSNSHGGPDSTSIQFVSAGPWQTIGECEIPGVELLKSLVNIRDWDGDGIGDILALASQPRGAACESGYVISSRGMRVIRQIELGGVSASIWSVASSVVTNEHEALDMTASGEPNVRLLLGLPRPQPFPPNRLPGLVMLYSLGPAF